MKFNRQKESSACIDSLEFTASSICTTRLDVICPEIPATLIGLPTKEIQKAYGRKGFLNATLRSIPDFNDANQSVTYKMDVHEGPQYHMGQFLTKGFPDSIDKVLHDRWALKQGDVFDQGYSVEFSQKQVSEIMRNLFLERRAQNKPAPHLKFDNKIDRASLTIDVILELTN